MLLRLLPLPTAESPTPPTVLFTLPAPVSLPSSSPADPYAPHRLPAPPSLVGHAQACIANDLPCPTLLTGEASSWINTVVKEVTFLPQIGEIQVLLVDGSGVVMPLADDGAGRLLHKVRDHVVASGRVAPVAVGERRFEPLPLMRRDSTSMLKSFLGTLIGGKAPLSGETAARCSVGGREPTARQHRRLARATLVDCYRRWVLTGLKELLPPTYLLFSAHSILNLEAKKVAAVEAEIRVLMSIAGLRSPPSSPRASMDDGFSANNAPRSLRRSPSRQPASPDPSVTAADFPPLSAVPFHIRPTYSKHLADLLDSQARIAELERLIRRHEREERRARYEVYGQEKQPCTLPERTGRTIASRKIVGKPGYASLVGPLQSSPLAWGWTAEDAEAEHNAALGLITPPLSPSESIWSTSDELSSSSSSSSSEHGDDDIAIASPSDSERDLDELLSAYAYPVVDSKAALANARGPTPLYGLGIGFAVGQAI